jgi:hypothetical protein
MSDPRFNSVHLTAPRRQDYRRARQELFQACGNGTLYVAENKPASSSGTIHQNVDEGSGDTPKDAEFWLQEKEYTYPLKAGLNTLGRAPDNDVVVPDEFISRRHCTIVIHLHNGQCEVHDTASKNGTFLNGLKLAAPSVIRAGDEIRVCDRCFIFVTRDAVQHNTRTAG